MNLEDILLIGTRASQPAATLVAEGMLYSVTDEGHVVEQSRSGAWIIYAGSGSGSFSSGGGIPFPLPVDGEDGEDGFAGPSGSIGPAGPSGGVTGWALAGSWDFSVGVVNIDFIGLATYSEILIIFRAVNTASSNNIYLIVSIDNGSTFLNTSGDYEIIGSNGDKTNAAFFNVFGAGASTPRACVINITPFNSTNPKAIISPIKPLNVLVPIANALNALRFTTDGANFSAGSIRVYGR